MLFSEVLSQYPPYRAVREQLERNISPVNISGVTESAQGHLIYSLWKQNSAFKSLVVCYSDMEAKALYNDISFFTDRVFYFPAKEYTFYNIASRARDHENRRLETLYHLTEDEGALVVTSIDALMCYTLPEKLLLENTLLFEPGMRFDLEALSRQLTFMGYTREELVEGKGQFSVRGGILDVFPPQMSNPLRIEFFDDEVDSVRVFDAESQRTIEQLPSGTVIPCSELLLTEQDRQRIEEAIIAQIKKAEKKKTDQAVLIETMQTDLEQLRENLHFPALDKYAPLIYGGVPSMADFTVELSFIIDPRRIQERAKTFAWEKGEQLADLKIKQILSADKTAYYREYHEILTELLSHKLAAIDVLSPAQTDIKYRYLCDFTTKTGVSFHGKIEYLYDDLTAWCERGATVVILGSSRSRCENLAGALKEKDIACSVSKDGSFVPGAVTLTEGSIAKGFEYPQLNFVIVSDREIFEGKERRARRRLANTKRIQSYNEIGIGDYVVHQAHGIGIYEGIKKITVNNVTKDYLKIRYQGSDMLYVPVNQLDVLYKYSGNTEKQLKLNTLGGADWNRTRQRAKKATQDMARQLISLYAQREKTKGFRFSPDTVWQRDFEDTFEYTETEDQLRSIEEVKADMESDRPMDRLLCGDVGFGKTEVALRAAFKAVQDSKQVAYLCPTTILAMQHFNTFTNRMMDFPVKVEMLSRFRTPAQIKDILKRLKSGEIDILIGTHKILQKDVQFKDLGLLIVDEEQRFGVAHKERLKELKQNIDVLTMTATPIPRTLHMSMISVRDMSVLTEPPQNRYPVQTYVLEDNPAVILDAIRNELSRGGQVYYLSNRVQGIYRKAEWLQSQLPEANVAVGHGQMSKTELEDIMYDMVNGRTDVLVCTTIIETGLDIPNANTMIIEDSDRMGLAQLYQLRGRVGRSNRAAYAYLTYKPDKVLSDVAQKRLRAVKEFTEFGSGFKIAMRDLEIRGAGNILGAQQHGHMDAVGYDMYCKLLKESVDEEMGVQKAPDFSVLIDLDVNAFLPERYIADDEQRISLYKKIAAIESAEDKMEIQDELIDRYGDPPVSAQNVVHVGYLRALASKCGIFELTQKAGFLQMKFQENTIEAQTVFDLGDRFQGQIKLIPSERALIHYKIKNKSNILEETEAVLTFILQHRQDSKEERNDLR